MCFLYSYGEGQKKKYMRLQNGGWGVTVFGQEWQLWNEGISQSATLCTHVVLGGYGVGVGGADDLGE